MIEYIEKPESTTYGSNVLSNTLFVESVTPVYHREDDGNGNITVTSQWAINFVGYDSVDSFKRDLKPVLRKTVVIESSDEISSAILQAVNLVEQGAVVEL